MPAAVNGIFDASTEQGLKELNQHLEPLAYMHGYEYETIYFTNNNLIFIDIFHLKRMLMCLAQLNRLQLLNMCMLFAGTNISKVLRKQNAQRKLFKYDNFEQIN
jgi:hypothetical protein